MQIILNIFLWFIALLLLALKVLYLITIFIEWRKANENSTLIIFVLWIGEDND